MFVISAWLVSLSLVNTYSLKVILKKVSQFGEILASHELNG